MSLSPQEILAVQPFISKIGRIDSVEPLREKWAVSGETFKITAGGINYKLRCCRDESDAAQIKDNVSRLPHYFPKFISQEGRFVLFAWIEDGEYIENLSISDCQFIGKMMGEAHALGMIAKGKNPNMFFDSRIPLLREAFSETDIERIISKYKKITEKLDLDIVLEFSDVHKKNFIKDKAGNIYYVDEEGLNYKVKGLGIAKPLFTTDFIRTKEEKDAFWKGYNEYHSSDYFNKDYEKFVCFVQLLRTITVRLRTKADYSREIAEVYKMLEE